MLTLKEVLRGTSKDGSGKLIYISGSTNNNIPEIKIRSILLVSMLERAALD
jgi:hypothetical protein